MARPITPTPQLDVKASREFLTKIDRDQHKPVGPVSTPKIDKTIRMITSDAEKREE